MVQLAWCTKLLDVWAGLTGEHLIGPCVLRARLTGPLFPRFLHRYLPQFLDNLSLLTWQWMWLLYDDAPAHFNLDRSSFRVFRAVATTVTWPHYDRLLLFGVPWNMWLTPTSLTPKSNFGVAYRMQQPRFVHPGFSRPSLIATSCWHICLCPWRAFRAYLVIYVISKSSSSQEF
jgi:hypothetical protein